MPIWLESTLISGSAVILAGAAGWAAGYLMCLFVGRTR